MKKDKIQNGRKVEKQKQKKSQKNTTEKKRTKIMEEE